MDNFFIIEFVLIQESTVHGIRYFVDGENAFHRFVWVVLMACSVGYLSFLIHDSYSDWQVGTFVNTRTFFSSYHMKIMNYLLDQPRHEQHRAGAPGRARLPRRHCLPGLGYRPPRYTDCIQHVSQYK